MGGPVNPSHIEGVKKARLAQEAYAKEKRAGLKLQRDGIKTAMRERFQGLSEQALVLLKEDRAKEYQQVLARQREDKHELKQDQAQGRRRYDLLADYGRSSANENRQQKDAPIKTANTNLPPFMRTAQIVRDLNQRALSKGADLTRYIARAMQADREKARESDGRHDHSDKQDRTVATAQAAQQFNGRANPPRRRAHPAGGAAEEAGIIVFHRDGRREHTAQGLQRGDKGGGRGR